MSHARTGAIIAFACAGMVVLASCADPVYRQWETRRPLPSCGTVQLRQGESLGSHGKKGIECLRAGRDSGRGGELRIRYPTVEGDPITEYYRVTPKGTTEVYTDATNDPNGDQRWHYGRCDRPKSVLDVAC
jgi:hypothetical protein